MYTIEGWEIERHTALVRRARYLGGFLDGPDGTKVRILKQEYPYDIGLWSNVVQGMGTLNVSNEACEFHHVNLMPDSIMVLAFCIVSYSRQRDRLQDKWI